MRSMTDEGLTPSIKTSSVASGDTFSFKEKEKKQNLLKLKTSNVMAGLVPAIHDLGRSRVVPVKSENCCKFASARLMTA